ncbi:MAG TPA: AAA family ATPase [Thermoanaerobaculia bacterium]
MGIDLTQIGLKVSNHKSFGDKPAGFDGIRRFNIIIGRNNTGKSALLDLLDHAVTLEHKQPLPLSRDAAVWLTAPVQESEITRIVSGDWGDYRPFLGRALTWTVQDKAKFVRDVDAPGWQAVPRELWQSLVSNRRNPLDTFRTARLAADRDIVPEAAGPPGIAANGEGATRTIHHFRSSADRDSTIVERVMLNDLNEIFAPDSVFSRIDTREINARHPVATATETQWEVYLDEADKGRVALSHSGSGLKTVILILAVLHLTPLVDRARTEQYFFAFEEIENNLHPAVQRRLLRYLRDRCHRHGCHFFITTHSPVEIDYFARDLDAQVLYVQHDQKCATVTPVSGYLHGKAMLDDLDIRASDMLQSNGIIWVEGPSDRIYLNKWIELWTDGKLREGAHYQVLQYGGALLAHLTAGLPDTESAAIAILTVNRNAAIVMDSDKAAATDELKTAVVRMSDEIVRSGGLAWVTAGRTVEHYIPKEIYQSTIGSVPKPYADAIEYIRMRNAKAVVRLPTDKVKLARRVVPLLTANNVAATLDLQDRLSEIVGAIKKWNKMT